MSLRGWHTSRAYVSDMQRTRIVCGGGVHNDKYKWIKGGGDVSEQFRRDYNRRMVAYRIKEILQERGVRL